MSEPFEEKMERLVGGRLSDQLKAADTLTPVRNSGGAGAGF